MIKQSIVTILVLFSCSPTHAFSFNNHFFNKPKDMIPNPMRDKFFGKEKDTTKPIISLIGASELNITIGSQYQDDGATANDNEDGDISKNIVINNPTDSNKIGRYEITYNVKDSSKNQAKQVSRYVNVQYGDYPTEQLFTSIKTDSDITLPDYLETYKDKNFHSKVTRISDRTIESANDHPYPKQGSAWNSNMTILRMGYRLYNSTTFEELPITKGSDGTAYANIGSPAHGTGDIRWSHSNPNIVYVLSSNKKFISVKINKERDNSSLEQEFVDLSSYEDVSFGHNEGNLDYADQYIVFSAKKPNDDSVYALLYKIGDENISWEKKIAHASWSAKSSTPNYFDWITVDPLGEYIVSSLDNKIYRYNMQLEGEQLLAEEASHGDIGIDQNGDAVYVQFRFHGEEGIWSYNLKNLNKIKLLPSKYNGGHISCRNYQRSGWCYMNGSEEGYREVFAIKLDDGSGTVQRYAQTHMSFKNHDYAQVNVSPNGKKVLFASDWDIEAEIDTYHVSYPYK